MSRFVLDCSTTLAWCFSDENSEFAERTLEALSSGEALVPSLWPLEVLNVLLSAQRRKRISEAQIFQFLELLKKLPIHVQRIDPTLEFDAIISLGLRTGLTSYDASYLDLALREGLPLATLDQDLSKAANRLGVELL